MNSRSLIRNRRDDLRCVTLQKCVPPVQWATNLLQSDNRVEWLEVCGLSPHLNRNATLQDRR